MTDLLLLAILLSTILNEHSFVHKAMLKVGDKFREMRFKYRNG